MVRHLVPVRRADGRALVPVFQPPLAAVLALMPPEVVRRAGQEATGRAGVILAWHAPAGATGPEAHPDTPHQERAAMAEGADASSAPGAGRGTDLVPDPTGVHAPGVRGAARATEAWLATGDPAAQLWLLEAATRGGLLAELVAPHLGDPAWAVLCAPIEQVAGDWPALPVARLELDRLRGRCDARAMADHQALLARLVEAWPEEALRLLGTGPTRAGAFTAQLVCHLGPAHWATLLARGDREARVALLALRGRVGARPAPAVAGAPRGGR